MRVIVSAAALFALAACTTPLSATLVSAPDFKARAKQEIRAALFNPASAIWGPGAVFKVENGATTVCQTVNAENQFGGMTGNQVAAVDFTPGRDPMVAFGVDAARECASLFNGITYRY